MTHDDALAAARRLCRTLGSAPDPQRRAESALALLRDLDTWSPAARARIVAVSEWVGTRPQPATLKPRLQALLRALDG